MADHIYFHHLLVIGPEALNRCRQGEETKNQEERTWLWQEIYLGWNVSGNDISNIFPLTSHVFRIQLLLTQLWTSPIHLHFCRGYPTAMDNKQLFDVQISKITLGSNLPSETPEIFVSGFKPNLLGPSKKDMNPASTVVKHTFLHFPPTQPKNVTESHSLNRWTKP